MSSMMIKRPIICYCSGNQLHSTDHIECRCDGYERFRTASAEFAKVKKAGVVLWPKRILGLGSTDPDGYPLCAYCGLIAFKNWLVHCPYCDKFFKGPTFWFNKKFHYECEECG